MERGADVDAQDNPTPLHLASYDGRIAIARVLLDHGAAANSKGDQGRTPLHSVAQGRHLYSEDDGIRVANLLLERGADFNAPDEDSRTPLHLASYCGRAEIACYLTNANSKSDPGHTQLHAAAEGGEWHDILGAQLLLDRGADVDVPDDNNQTPLHLSSYFGKVEVVLIPLNAHANAGAKDAQGQTPIHLVSGRPYYYSQGGGVGIVQLILDHGADVNVQDKNHATPSGWAPYHGRTEIA